jgi:hypothetical protein
MFFTLKVDKIIDSIFATDTSFFTLKIEILISTQKNLIFCSEKIENLIFYSKNLIFYSNKISFFTLIID